MGGELGRPPCADSDFVSDCRRCRLELRIVMIYIRGRLVGRRRSAGYAGVYKANVTALYLPGAWRHDFKRQQALNIPLIQVKCGVEFPLLAFASLLPAVVVALAARVIEVTILIDPRRGCVEYRRKSRPVNPISKLMPRNK